MIDLDSRRRMKRWRTATICLVVAVCIGVWHNRRAAEGKNDFVTSSVRWVTSPFVRAVNGTLNFTRSRLSWIFRGAELERENTRLRSENSALKFDVATLKEADITARRLRSQLGLSDSPALKLVAADVITFRVNPHIDTLTLNRGLADRVVSRSPVLTGEGLVGQVEECDAHNSIVALITDQRSSVGVMVQREQSRAQGVCRGAGNGTLNLLYTVPGADIKVGDVMITSGLGGRSGVYPKGIPVGVVVSITPDATGSNRNIVVRPSARMERLEEVFVAR